MTTTTTTRCKSHPYESVIGVCAICLHDRLVALIAFRHDSLPLSSAPPPLQQPPPLTRSLSHRQSFGESPSQSHHPRLFFSTPQLSATTGQGLAPTTDFPKKKRRSFSMISNLFLFRFRSRDTKISENLQSPPRDYTASPFDPRASDSGVPGQKPAPSWFKALMSGKTRGSRRAWDGEFPTSGKGGFSSRQGGGRGGIPMDIVDDEEEESPGCRIPAPTPLRRHRRAPSKGKRSLSGLAVFMNPLVRASPQQRCQAGVRETVISGDLRNSGGIRGGAGGRDGSAVLESNRSRKIAGFGRLN